MMALADVSRVARRTALGAITVGAAGLLVLSLMGWVWAGAGGCLGMLVGVVNLRMTMRSAGKGAALATEIRHGRSPDEVDGTGGDAAEGTGGSNGNGASGRAREMWGESATVGGSDAGGGDGDADEDDDRATGGIWRSVWPSGQGHRMPLGTFGRLGAVTAIGVGLLLLEPPLGAGVLAGVALFELMFVANLFVVLIRELKAQGDPA